MTCSQKCDCQMPRSPFCKRRGESLSPLGICAGESCFDIMPACGEIRIPGRQSPDAMQVVGQDNDGLEGEWPASADRLENLPEVVNVFGQEFPAAFQQRDCEEERAARNKGANILWHQLGLTQLLKAGCVSLSRPTRSAISPHFSAVWCVDSWTLASHTTLAPKIRSMCFRAKAWASGSKSATPCR